jgi:hypothetical protein
MMGSTSRVPHEPQEPPFGSRLDEQHCPKCGRITVWFDPTQRGNWPLGSSWRCSGQSRSELDTATSETQNRPG